ncbi:MAG: hypothetical protein GY743_14205 [Planctomycetaceae bacterium]|nr:hypothetical protein [Planctomycetaceae bacterium]
MADFTIKALIHETTFAENYLERAFQKIKTGDSETQAKEHLGEPLYETVSEPFCERLYADQNHSDFLNSGKSSSLEQSYALIRFNAAGKFVNRHGALNYRTERAFGKMTIHADIEQPEFPKQPSQNSLLVLNQRYLVGVATITEVPDISIIRDELLPSQYCEFTKPNQRKPRQIVSTQLFKDVNARRGYWEILSAIFWPRTTIPLVSSTSFFSCGGKSKT